MASDHKYKRLDSIRGLAAFSVGVGHAALLAPFLPGSWLHRVIVAIFNGHYAVDVFFVLSGFVLTNMIREVSGPHYVAYLGRRLLRLYPPLWAGLLLACVLHAFVSVRWPCGDALVRAGGCHFIGGGPVSIYGALRSAFPTSYRIDPVVWSIRVEIEASLFYPLVLLLWRRSGRAGRVLMLVGAILMSYFSPDGFSTPQPHYMLFFVGLPHFALLFLTGIAISDYRLAAHENAVLALGVILLLFCGFFLHNHTGMADLLATTSAAALISVAAYRCPPWLAATLDNPVVQKLGEISYSYYLMNAIAVWVVARIIAGSIGTASAVDLFAIYAFGAAAVSAVAAYAMNQVIEKPCIRASRATEKYLLNLIRRSGPSAANVA